MLSYASGVLGQSLIDNMSGKNAIRREALEAFLNSARYGYIVASFLYLHTLIYSFYLLIAKGDKFSVLILFPFLLFCRFARNAENYDLVMTAVRHYWNASLPLVSQPIERELLREPIKVMLQCITATAEKVKKTEVHITLS